MANLVSNISSSESTVSDTSSDEKVDPLASEETLKSELLVELPRWIISSFGVGKHEPNLFSGYDTSPEELRWKSVQCIAANNPQAYVSLSLSPSTASYPLYNAQLPSLRR